MTRTHMQTLSVSWHAKLSYLRAANRQRVWCKKHALLEVVIFLDIENVLKKKAYIYV